MTGTKCGTYVIESSFLSRKAAIDWALCAPANCNERLRPTHFADDESASLSAENALSAKNATERLALSLSHGCFLFGPEFKIDISTHQEPLLSTVAWHFARTSDTMPNCAKEILASLGASGAIWGFACDWSEYQARHQYTIRFIDGGSEQGFIGVDPSRYVPGLYWQTFLSKAYLAQMQVNAAVVAESIDAQIDDVGCGIVLQLYSHPGKWENRREIIDEFLAKSDAFFSMRRVTIPSGLRLREMMARAPLRQTWP